MVRILAISAVLLALTAPARGSGTPMDQARFDAWRASHIVVTDAAGRVVEVWKGDLKVGDVLPVNKDEWKILTPQVIRHAGGIGGDIEGWQVNANRVILFLEKAGPNRPDGKKPGEWVGLHPFFVSAGGNGVFAQVYAIEKGIQPVYAVSKSEAAFKAEYLPLAERRTAIDTAIAEPDVRKRAEKLRPFVAEHRVGFHEAAEALAGCGEAGVSPLTAALFRRDRGENRFGGEVYHELAIKSLVKIGRPAAGELMKFLAFQKAYWTLNAPDLGPDWYANGGGPAGVQMRLLFAALADPEVYVDVPADKRSAVSDLHEQWTTVPALVGVKTAGKLHPAKMTAAVLSVWERK